MNARLSARWFRLAGFAAGALVSALVLLGLGEAYLRWFPPADFRPYLGEGSGLTGPYRSDATFGVQYRSYQVFADQYRDRLRDPGIVAATASPRCWAMFGNSFVHMGGQLADTTRARLPDRPVFNLGRNEPVYVRAAQFELLLDEGGLRPERAFFVLMPLDTYSLAQHSLAQTGACAQGGIVFQPNRPTLLPASRLALLGWVRLGRHQAVPACTHAQLTRGVPASVAQDLRTLCAALRRTGLRHGVPVTVVLNPTYDQVVRGAGFGFQDAAAQIAGAAGLDVCEVRAPFLAAYDKPGLFIPDRHYSERGNRLLLDALLAHLDGPQRPGLSAQRAEGP